MKKLDKTTKSVILILISNILFSLFIYYVVLPYAEKEHIGMSDNGPMPHSIYSAIFARLMFYGSVFINTIVTLVNIEHVKFFRWLVYPLSFAAFYLAFHIMLFIEATILLWFGIVTIPLGGIILLIILVIAIVMDIDDIKKLIKNKKINKQ